MCLFKFQWVKDVIVLSVLLLLVCCRLCYIAMGSWDVIFILFIFFPFRYKLLKDLIWFVNVIWFYFILLCDLIYGWNHAFILWSFTMQLDVCKLPLWKLKLAICFGVECFMFFIRLMLIITGRFVDLVNNQLWNSI